MQDISLLLVYGMGKRFVNATGEVEKIRLATESKRVFAEMMEIRYVKDKSSYLNWEKQKKKDFRIAVYGYRAAAQCGDDSGEDFRVEFQILHCEKKVWNPFRAGGCIFPVLEERTSLKFIKNPCAYREKKSIICFRNIVAKIKWEVTQDDRTDCRV